MKVGSRTVEQPAEFVGVTARGGMMWENEGSNRLIGVNDRDHCGALQEFGPP